MIRRATVIALAIGFSGCAAPVAKQYYAACVDAGHAEAECRMRAIDINQRAWAGAGASLHQAGQSMQQVRPSAWQPSPADSISCRSVTAGVATTTTCQ